MISIQPLNDRLIVQRLKEEKDKKIGSLYIPEMSKEKPQMGTVIAVGTGKITDQGIHIPSQLKVGDTVLFGKYSGNDLTYNEQEYLIMREDEIFGIVKEENGHAQKGDPQRSLDDHMLQNTQSEKRLETRR